MIKLLLLIPIILALAIMIPQESHAVVDFPYIAITTDKKVYTHNDSVVITGLVHQWALDSKVIIIVEIEITPDGAAFLYYKIFKAPTNAKNNEIIKWIFPTFDSRLDPNETRKGTVTIKYYPSLNDDYRDQVSFKIK